MNSRLYLIACGILNSIVALLHIAIIFIGPKAYEMLSFGDVLTSQLQAGSITPHVMTLGIACMFAFFAAYSFSAAGMIKRLPLTNSIFFAIAGVYLLRAFALFPQIFPSEKLMHFYDALTLQLVNGGTPHVHPLDVEMTLIVIFFGAFHWYASYYLLRENQRHAIMA